LKECPSELCLVCNNPFGRDDVVIINPEPEERKQKKDELKERKKVGD
jgi:hypothetical protein